MERSKTDVRTFVVLTFTKDTQKNHTLHEEGSFGGSLNFHPSLFLVSDVPNTSFLNLIRVGSSSSVTF